MQANFHERIKTCDGKHQRILAKKFEPLVWRDVKDFLLGGLAKELLAQAKMTIATDTAKSRHEKLEAALAKTEAQIEVLAERIAELPKGIDPQSLYAQLEQLQTTKAATIHELAVTDDGIKPNDEVVGLVSLEEFTKGLRKQLNGGETNPELQTAIIRKIVERIELLPEGYEISFHVGKNHYRAELGAIPCSAIFHGVTAVCGLGAAKKKRPALRREPCRSANPKKNVAGSTFLLNGGPTRSISNDRNLTLSLNSHH